MRHEQRAESLQEIIDRVPGLGKHRLAATRLLTFALAEGGAVSKVGGAFLWPPNEEWPASSGQPWIAVAQVLRADFPEMGFPEGADVFQLLWSGEWTDDSASHVVCWRSLTDNLEIRELPDSATEFGMERQVIDEFPPPLLWATRALADSLAADPDSWDFRREASEVLVASGPKIGGYPAWIQSFDRTPQCNGGHRMRLVLTVASAEEGSMWVEEQACPN